MSKSITVSAPGKLMLLGEHAVVYNHPCLVTAVDQRMMATFEILDTPEFQLEARDVNIFGYKKPLSELGRGDIPKGAKFVEIAVKNFFEIHKPKSPLPPLIKGVSGRTGDFKGIRVTTTSEFSSKFGFGSSSASTVCSIKALSELFKLKLNQKEIFDLSYKTVLDVQGKGSGFDVAAAVYGGILYFLTGGKVIEQLNIDSLPLIVGYSGIKADTVSLINKVKETFVNRQDRLNEIYSGIEVLVNGGKETLIKSPAFGTPFIKGGKGDLKRVKKDWRKLGELMNKNQEYLSELGVSSEKLDKMIKAALDAGAYGAKLSGAGGGDCMIAIALENKKQKVEEAIKKAGGIVIPINTNAEGVRVEAI